MIELNDKNIRSAFIPRLLRSKNKPKAIFEELRVHNGNAIADIVSIHKEAHCYEIKGQGDKIERAIAQGEYYDQAFRKITLITTSKQLKRAVNMLPSHWGIIEAKEVNHSIVFTYVRPAKKNLLFNKRAALLTLWKAELLNLTVEITSDKLDKSSRQQLTDMLSKHLSKQQASDYISKQLIERIS